MKKYRNLFLIITLLIVAPLVVNADNKEFGLYKYTIDNTKINDYLCEEIEGKQYRIYSNTEKSKVVLSKINEAPAYDYFIDFAKTNNCEPMTDEELDKFEKEDYVYNYYWRKDNSIKKVKLTYDVDRYFVMTEDNSIDENKLYFTKEDETITEVSNPNSEELATYYEEIFLKEVTEYNSEEIYYLDTYANAVEKLGKLSEEEYEEGLQNGDIYYTEVKNIVFEDFITLENTNFTVPKEAGIFGEDYKYDRSDILDVVTVNDKNYLVFTEENLGDPLVFDTEGNLIDFGLGKIMSPDYFESTQNDLIVLMIGIKNSDTKIYIMDSSFNIIYEEQYNNNYVEYLKTISNVDYISVSPHMIEDGDIRIIKVAKELKTSTDIKPGVETEEIPPVPQTLDNIGITILIATISISGLSGLIIYTKKNKSRA